MSGAGAASTAAAVDRAIELLNPAAAEIAARRGLNEAGYLDLLETDVESTGPTQDLMVTRLVPAIYERYWRPALGRLFKGATGPGMAEEMRIARLLLGLGTDDVVLDLACGPGNFSREFARVVGPGGLVVGLDASPTMLERGAAELRDSTVENLALVRGDATALPFADSSFDGACCFATLHLFERPDGAGAGSAGRAPTMRQVQGVIDRLGLIIVALIPLALRGVTYRAVGAGMLLRRNLLIYGLGGLAVPFVGIKAIDVAITALGLA